MNHFNSCDWERCVPLDLVWLSSDRHWSVHKHLTYSSPLQLCANKKWVHICLTVFVRTFLCVLDLESGDILENEDIVAESHFHADRASDLFRLEWAGYGPTPGFTTAV